MSVSPRQCEAQPGPRNLPSPRAETAVSFRVPSEPQRDEEEWGQEFGAGSV